LNPLKNRKENIQLLKRIKNAHKKNSKKSTDDNIKKVIMFLEKKIAEIMEVKHLMPAGSQPAVFSYYAIITIATFFISCHIMTRTKSAPWQLTAPLLPQCLPTCHSSRSITSNFPHVDFREVPIKTGDIHQLFNFIQSTKLSPDYPLWFYESKHPDPK